MGFEFFLAPGSSKETTVVWFRLGVNFEDTWQRRIKKDHTYIKRFSSIEANPFWKRKQPPFCSLSKKLRGSLHVTFERGLVGVRLIMMIVPIENAQSSPAIRLLHEVLVRNGFAGGGLSAHSERRQAVDQHAPSTPRHAFLTDDAQPAFRCDPRYSASTHAGLAVVVMPFDQVRQAEDAPEFRGIQKPRL